MPACALQLDDVVTMHPPPVKQHAPVPQVTPSQMSGVPFVLQSARPSFASQIPLVLQSGQPPHAVPLSISPKLPRAPLNPEMRMKYVPPMTTLSVNWDCRPQKSSLQASSFAVVPGQPECTDRTES